MNYFWTMDCVNLARGTCLGEGKLYVYVFYSYNITGRQSTDLDTTFESYVEFFECDKDDDSDKIDRLFILASGCITLEEHIIDRRDSVRGGVPIVVYDINGKEHLMFIGKDGEFKIQKELPETTTHRPHADVLIEWLQDNTKQLQCRPVGTRHWRNANGFVNDGSTEYRIKLEVNPLSAIKVTIAIDNFARWVHKTCIDAANR